MSAINIVNLGYKHALTLTLAAVATVSDLFYGQRHQRTASTPTLTQVYERSVLGRVACFGVSYTVEVTKKEKGAEHRTRLGSWILISACAMR